MSITRHRIYKDFLFKLPGFQRACRNNKNMPFKIHFWIRNFVVMTLIPLLHGTIVIMTFFIGCRMYTNFKILVKDMVLSRSALKQYVIIDIIN